MSGAWKHKLPQLFISHCAIIAADTMRSSHQVPAERNNIILHARNLKLDSSFHPATVCLRSLTAQRRFSSAARPSLLLFQQLMMMMMRVHIFTASPLSATLLFPFTSHFLQRGRVPVSAVDSIICRSHTDALARFPQQRALRKCQVSLFTCPLLPLAVLL